MTSGTEPIKNRKAPAVEPGSLTAQYDRMLSALNNHDLLQREEARHEQELKVWSRILQSDVLFAMVAPPWKQ